MSSNGAVESIIIHPHSNSVVDNDPSTNQARSKIGINLLLSGNISSKNCINARPYL